VQAGTDVKIGAVIGYIEEAGAESGESAAAPPSAPATPTAGTDESAKQSKDTPAADTSAAATVSQDAAAGKPGVFPQGAPAAAVHPLHVASPQPQPGTLQPKRQVGDAPAMPTPSPDLPKPVATPAPSAASAPAAPAPAHEGDQPASREPMTRMRRTIAAHLLKAKNETAMLTTFAEVDMSAIINLRKEHQEAFTKRNGIKLGFMSFFMKAAIDGLQRFPLVNASIDGNDIVYHHYVNMAIAVSTERGLAVPVIRNAHEKTFAELEKELVRLAEQAKTGRIPLDDLKGGTFTITNGGVFGSLLSTPLINPPQVAILGMHATQERPVAVNGKVEIRPMMYLALSYDHRLIDGKEAVQFLVHVRDRVAAPERLLLGL